MCIEDAKAILATLDDSIKEAIRTFITTANTKGEYVPVGDYGVEWRDNARLTLDVLAEELP